MNLQVIGGAPHRMFLKWAKISCNQHILKQIFFIPIVCCQLGLRSYRAKITIKESLRSKYVNNVSIGFNLDKRMVNRMVNRMCQNKVSSTEALRSLQSISIVVWIFRQRSRHCSWWLSHFRQRCYHHCSRTRSNNMCTIIDSHPSHQFIDQQRLVNFMVVLIDIWTNNNLCIGSGLWFNKLRFYTYCNARPNLDNEFSFIEHPQLYGQASLYSVPEHSGSH